MINIQWKEKCDQCGQWFINSHLAKHSCDNCIHKPVFIAYVDESEKEIIHLHEFY